MIAARLRVRREPGCCCRCANESANDRSNQSGPNQLSMMSLALLIPFGESFLLRRVCSSALGGASPFEERFTKGYKQSERHHRQLIWSTLIAAVIGALIGAAATTS